MTTSKELYAQAAELTRQADAMRIEETASARSAILDLMRENGLQPADFLADGGKGSKFKLIKNKSKGTVAAQFRNNETGETWTGRGRAPKWIAGKDKEAFRIAAE